MPLFQLPGRPVTLVFEDGSLKGLELEVRTAVPFDYYFDLTKYVSSPGTKPSGKKANAFAELEATLAEAKHMMARFAEISLISWNLADAAGKPVPATVAAFTAHVDPTSFGIMLGRYISAIGRVPAPLAVRSSSGSASRAPRASNRRRSSSAP